MLSASTGGLCLRSQPSVCFRISHRRVCIKKCASQSPNAASMSMLSRLATRLVGTEHTVASTSSGEVSYQFCISIEGDVQYFADFAEVYRSFFPSCAKFISRTSQSITTTPLYYILTTFRSLLMFNPTLHLRRVSHLPFRRCRDNSLRASKTHQGTYQGTSASNE